MSAIYVEQPVLINSKLLLRGKTINSQCESCSCQAVNIIAILQVHHVGVNEVVSVDGCPHKARTGNTNSFPSFLFHSSSPSPPGTFTLGSPGCALSHDLWCTFETTWSNLALSALSRALQITVSVSIYLFVCLFTYLFIYLNN